MFGRKGREEATTVIPFPEGTQEQFDLFERRVKAVIYRSSLEFQNKPLMGTPYAIVWVPDGHWTNVLIVDAGQALCKSDDEIWVAD